MSSLPFERENLLRNNIVATDREHPDEISKSYKMFVRILSYVPSENNTSPWLDCCPTRHESTHRNHLQYRTGELQQKIKMNLLLGPLRMSLKDGTTLSVVLIRLVKVKNVSQRINSLSLLP